MSWGPFAHASQLWLWGAVTTSFGVHRSPYFMDSLTYKPS